MPVLPECRSRTRKHPRHPGPGPAGAADLKKIFNADRIREIEELCLPESSRRDYQNSSGGHTPLDKK